jgi:hypothetical protein
MELRGRIVVDVAVDGVDRRDYPDFCDAYFSDAAWEDGTQLTQMELDELTDIYPEVVWEMACESLR